MAEAPAGDRIASVDILRGFAVMGIFAINVVSFAMPESAHFNPAAYGREGPADMATWFVTFILFDGKMRGLFTFLFGASLLLVIERAEARGKRASSAHYPRMLWLLALGAAHFVLLWSGDILVDYALVGLIAYAFRNMSPTHLLVAAAVFLLVQLGLTAGRVEGYFEAEAAAAAPDAAAGAIAGWRGMAGGFGEFDPARLSAELSLHHGTYADLVSHRAGAVVDDAIASFTFNGFETLAFMLAGMWGLKSGFLSAGWTPSSYRRIAAAGLATGAAGYAGMAAFLYAHDFRTSFVFALGVGLATLFRPVMVLGFAAAIMLVVRHRSALVDHIAAAGRAAFSNYIGATLVATTIFYGYGGGWYGRLSRWELYPLVLAMWAAMLLWSAWWLDRYRYGPFEWLWRSLSRGEAQLMRKDRRAAAA